MHAQPQSVIVYRSQGEQMRDEALWSEGYLTPTVAGDILLVILLLGVGIVVGGRIYERFRYQPKNARRLYFGLGIVGMGTVGCAITWCFNHLHFTIH